MWEPNLLGLSASQLLADYATGYLSRRLSLVGRKEVLNGKAKFGIFGDGKELPQLAMARVFQPGDWRSGYYRDQTFMLAKSLLTAQQFFAQLYADVDPDREPASHGRQMNCHFATRYISPQGDWLSQTDAYHSSADISPTGGQMARLLGLAYASLYYKQSPLVDGGKFSKQGTEIAFGTIGNASTSEGIFWEVLNAAGVLQVPLLISVWDDHYGISVPNALQTTKSHISKVLAGFHSNADGPGVDLFTCKGNDYPALLQTYRQAAAVCRSQHRPCLVHVTHITQPQGHSTSGSHERYKSKERLQFEEDEDGLQAFKGFLLTHKLASEATLMALEAQWDQQVESAKQQAWEAYQQPILDLRLQVQRQVGQALENSTQKHHLEQVCQRSIQDLSSAILRRDIQSTLDVCLRTWARYEALPRELTQYAWNLKVDHKKLYESHLYTHHRSPLKVPCLPPVISAQSPVVDGRQVIQSFFDHLLARDPRVFIIGEDVGQLGGVNLEFEGLQQKYGPVRVTDTGIREASILGQGIGAAMRGLRPIVDIQYLDYLLYCLQPLSDDLATLHYRSAGGQSAPVILRTKGHRLEGIWHTGSPMGMILSACAGVHVCVPRNAVQAVGLYQTLLSGDDPGIVVEVLNGYRLKEIMPDNIGVFTVPLGSPEVLRMGKDVTVVTYGANTRLALAAAEELKTYDIDLEIIDVQTLAPFDTHHSIQLSLRKTAALLCFDEDVPGGASAYMLQKILEEQNGYDYLDAKPRTLSAKPNRAAYGSDGDYFCKPNKDDLVYLVLQMMHERFPLKFSYVAYLMDV